MKKSYIILFLFTFFFINITVQAGVCNGDKGYNYCGVDKTLNNHSISFTSNGTLDGYFIKAGYKAKIDGNSYASVCIDPALSAPAEVFRNVRELDLSTTYDQGVYKIYQKFINEINFIDYDYNMAYFQYATRIWTIKNGFAYVSEGVDYENDAATFIGCSKLIDSSITTTTSKGINNSSNTYCFNSHKGKIKEYYDKVKAGYLWTNPFEDNSNISTSRTEDAENYIYTFTVDFKNFFTSYANAINKGNIDLKSAQFKACISINDEDCFQDESKVRWINNELGNTNNNTFTLTIPKSDYATYFPTGTESVTLNYSYRHPMNPNNVFISRYNADEMGYQRMIVIKEEETKERKTIGVSTIVENNTCSHTASGFTDSSGNSVSTIAAYYASCGCTANESLLSGGDLDFYKNKCDGTIINESYSGGISSCNDSQTYNAANSSTNYENYTLGYHKTTTINSYCSESCDEVIGINNLKGKYTTIAGRFFYFNEYPTLNPKKTCKMTVKYNDWYKDYYNTDTSDLGLLNIEINNYNNYLFDKGVNSATDVGGGTCYCGNPAHPCGTYDTWQYYYDEYYYDVTANKINYNTLGPFYYNTGCSNSKPAARYTSGSIESSLASLNTHFNYLTTCYTYLKNYYGGSATQFYPFDVDLKYYYEQEYSSDEYGWKRNDEKPNNINDSDYKTNNYLSSPYLKQTGSYNDTTYNDTTYKYPYVSATSSVYNPNATKGIGTQKFSSNDVQIVREVETEVKYERPLKEKYVNIFTSSITEFTTNENFINLGYVYDIHISSKTGSKATGHTNENYYEFIKLGDTGNNRLFNHFKTGSTIRRYCDYEITSDLTECKGNNCKLNVVYRSVDPGNIDPNDRLEESNKGFSNWKTTNAQVIKKKIETDAETNDTYNPENLEYSFTLDSRTISAIRKENEGYKYDDWNDFLYTCDDGNKCESKFITTIKNNNLEDVWGNKINNILKNYNGRDSWKNITETYSGSNKYIIDGDTTNIIDLTS